MFIKVLSIILGIGLGYSLGYAAIGVIELKKQLKRIKENMVDKEDLSHTFEQINEGVNVDFEEQARRLNVLAGLSGKVFESVQRNAPLVPIKKKKVSTGKFNIGDKVIGNSKASRYSITGVGFIGEVTPDTRKNCGKGEFFVDDTYAVDENCFDLYAVKPKKVAKKAKKGKK